MIQSATNKEIAIVTDIRKTLEQLKKGGVPNQKLVLEYINTHANEYSPDCLVEFYVDADRSQLLFVEDTDSNAANFSTQGTRTLYQPPDEKINFSAGISEQYAQPLYYVTAIFADGKEINTTYRNVDNLVFQSVIVTTKANAKFSTNDNTCMIYPRTESIDNMQQNDDLAYALFPMDLYIQLNVFDWEKLSEENRWAAGQSAANLIRNALYQDRYRNVNCTFYNKDLRGTSVGNCTILPSDAVLKVKVEVKCAFYVSSSTY